MIDDYLHPSNIGCVPKDSTSCEVICFNSYPPKYWEDKNWNFFILIMCVTHFGAHINFLKFKLIWSSRNEDIWVCMSAIAHNGSTRDKTRRFYGVISICIYCIYTEHCSVWSYQFYRYYRQNYYYGADENFG